LRKYAHALSIIMLSFTCLSACTSHEGERKTGLLSKMVDITDNEDKAIKEIIGFYGGRCDYGVEKKVYIGRDNETNFWIKFSQSANLDSFAQLPELPGSNIAYLFYKNLGKEKDQYDQIRSELVFSSSKKMVFVYTPLLLEKVKLKMQLVDKIVALIENKKFDDIKNFIAVDTSLFNYNVDELIANLKKAESQYGNASAFIPYGFKFLESPDGRDILHISGLIVRDKQSNNFSVTLDPNIYQEKIYLLNYKL
jgi:hypothetical protein